MKNKIKAPLAKKTDLSLGSEVSELMSLNKSLNVSELRFLHTAYKKFLVLRQATGGQTSTRSTPTDPDWKNQSQK